MSLVSPSYRSAVSLLLPTSRTPKRATTSRTRNSLARVPRARKPPRRIPSPIPIPFPPDGLSFLPRRRSTLKVIFRRPENVKPSAVSKRSRGDAERVSKFPSYSTVPLFLFSPFPPFCTSCPPARDLHLALYEPGLPDEKGSVIFFSRILGFDWSRLQTLKKIHARKIMRFEILSRVSIANILTTCSLWN